MKARRPGAVTVVCILAMIAAACGGGGSGGTKNDLTVDVASYDIAVGPPSRVTVGLQTENSLLVNYGTVTMQFTYLGTRDHPTASTVFTAPVTGTYLPLPGTNVPQPMPTQPKAVQANVGRGVYAAQAGFDQAGFWGVEVLAKYGGGSHRGRASFEVLAQHAVPAPGDAAPPSQTLTVDSQGVPIAAVDSRAGTGGTVPDPELHRTTIAAAIAAHRPAVVVFSTPVFCQSQFCGPVTDMVDDLAKTYGDRASFIHVEVWKDGQARVPNDAVTEWHMDNEPWVYLIGSDGKIVLRLDNVATRAELEPYLKQLPVIGPAA
jgi:hypothetical protein